MKHPKAKLVISGLLLALVGVMLAGSMRKVNKAILILGGSPKREVYGAKYAVAHPDMPIWVSGGSPKEYSDEIFAKAGIKSDRYTLDYRAVDTVTNFTTLVDEFKARQITDVYVITDTFHMPRAQIIGSVVLGSRGIKMHPVPIPPQMAYYPEHKYREKEITSKSVRDGARSVLWLFTGVTLNDRR
ncbi:hypothetical protein Syn7502_03568 [Synechococcus sp. PCC 7502]|uniref:YdcF family protein n=1 Tax=Synechococcus sp. PCC 7502 TaxID=1173263 RepID=UPI00029FC1B3|nr:YdcF family protein [Synechococcus sp. PCC 7502]AFY75405.1 hypothetical protein Syn7502_03568 [Synechococcus sp. PCC 7502]